MPLGPDPWIIVRLRRDGDVLRLSHRTHDGRRAVPEPDAPREAWPPRPPWDTPPVGAEPLPDRVVVAEGFHEAVARLLELQGARNRYGPYATGPMPLPVFLRPPPPLAEADWEAMVGFFLAERFGDDGVQVVRLAPGRPRPRSRFALPIRLLTVGPEAEDAVGPLLGAGWYAGEPAVRDFGLRVDASPSPDEALARLREGSDIVVADPWWGPELHGVIRALRPPQRPRLLVRLMSGEERLPRLVPPPRGCALLWIPPDAHPGDLLRSFVYGIIHDYPLHEALKTAFREGSGLTSGSPGPLGHPWLVADPATNQSLRMADVYESLLRETDELTRGIHPGSIRSVLDGVEEEEVGLMGGVRESAGVAEERWEEVTRVADARPTLHWNFTQETTGLVPYARLRESLEGARRARAEAEAALRNVARDSMAVDEVARRQDRRVEVELDLLTEADDGTLFYRPGDPEGDRSLGPGQGLRLRAWIGTPSGRSYMEGEPPPLDPLLPPTDDEDGHELDIVFFEKDFELLSPRLVRVRLPRAGGTEPAEFELRAPREARTARGRLVVYHENQLLQSFVLTATVSEDEAEAETELRVRLETSRTRRFTNLDALRPRHISLGVNDDDGTHTLFVKKGPDAPAPVPLPKATLAAWTRQFREILERYAWDDAGRTAGFDYRQRGPVEPGERFRSAIRELARLGGGIHDQIFLRRRHGLRPLLTDLRDGDDRVVQITRHDPNFAFPWTILYDYPLPTEISGRPPPPVCLGEPLDHGEGGPADDGGDPDGTPRRRRRRKGCPHNPGRDVYCVEGFWGVRHRLEQLMPHARRRDETMVVKGDALRPAVRLALSVRTGDVDAMDAELRQELAQAVEDLQPDDDVLDLLWDDTRRPLALVVLGHLAVEPEAGEPVGRRILLLPREAFPGGAPPEAWLQPTDIQQWTQDYDELDGDPAPLVFLMACESGATEIAELSGFVTSLADAGVAAVVGTESTVFASLASRFARDAVLGLWDGSRTLGEVVQDINRDLLRSGIPLPFAFSTVGNLDLRIEVTS